MAVLFYTVCVPGVGACSDHMKKHPAAVALVVSAPVGCTGGVPVGADDPGRRGGGCWRSCRGLFAFYTLPCLVFLLIIWKNSSRAAAGVPGGVVFFHPVGAGVRFLLKKRTKKRKHGNV